MLTQSNFTAVIKMAHRPYLRALSRRNRRAWAIQRARLSPVVPISSAVASPIKVCSPAITVCRPRTLRAGVSGFFSRLCIFS